MFFNIQILKMNIHEILFQPGIVLMSVFVWKVKFILFSGQKVLLWEFFSGYIFFTVTTGARFLSK